MIFGYGSLIAAQFINGRGMRRQYEESDLILCELMGYRRGWNAYCEGIGRFLGIVEDSRSRVNGVMFPLDLFDLDAFLKSEGFEYLNCVYNFVDVTDKIVSFVPNQEKVYTCVTANFCDDLGKVPDYYMNIIVECLVVRGWNFTSDFLKLTDDNKDNDKHLVNFVQTVNQLGRKND